MATTNKRLFKWSRSLDQDAHHVHIWRNLLLNIGTRAGAISLLSNGDDPGFSGLILLTYFMARSTLVAYAF